MSDQEMTIQKFEQDFHKLKTNREKIPLVQLTTRYERAYTALTNEVRNGAAWYTDTYIQTLVASWPLHEKDEAGSSWLENKKASILRQEHQSGGLYDQQVAALLDKLDLDSFYDLVYQLYARLETEAFDPYWQRHNRWVGKPGNRWIYNDIIKRFWYPPGKSDRWPKGVWMDNEYHAYMTCHPPHIQPDGGA